MSEKYVHSKQSFQMNKVNLTLVITVNEVQYGIYLF